MPKDESAKKRNRPPGRKAPAAKDERPQSERFIEAARIIEADESGQSFESAAISILCPKARADKR